MESLMPNEEEKVLRRILHQINRVTGFDARQYRAPTLKRRLERRLLATKSKSYKEYLLLLKKDFTESHKFLDDLSINVSDFFRDRRIFITLKEKILPDMLEEISANGGKRIRIWSIGCAKGQEPYSLAIILNEMMENEKKEFNISIHATDINKALLKHASKGLYQNKEIQNVPKKYLNKYFAKMNKSEFQIKENIRKLIKFRQHNIISENILGKFHLILCRNLFIFFTPELQKKTFIKIHSSLKKDGILVLGTAETPKDGKLFRILSSRDHVYQKITPQRLR
ncbi:MAG: protein-glutamate O-methyltransferase CheR [Candidatus Aminicenantes bacterium]|nr:MAG: protein-glutamate O-methyltransferase CheR [Candidatus Aminicenantes bacterium]